MEETHSKTNFTVPRLTWIPTNREIRLLILLTCQPFCNKCRLSNARNSGNDGEGRTALKPFIQTLEFVISSTHFACLWRTCVVGCVNTSEWLKSTWWRRGIFLILLFDQTKTNVTPGQNTFVLGMKQYLQQRHIRSQTVGSIFRLDLEKLSVLIPYQDLGFT